MGTFGKLGQRETKTSHTSDADAVIRRRLPTDLYADARFDEGDERPYAIMSYISIAVLSAVFYGVGYYSFGFTSEQKFSVLPMLSIMIAYAITSIAWAIASGFKGNRNSKDNKEKYPAVAFLGIGVGVLYAMYKHDMNITGLFAIDWHNQLFGVHASLGEANNQARDIIANIVSGAGMTLGAYAFMDRYVFSRGLNKS